MKSLRHSSSLLSISALVALTSFSAFGCALDNSSPASPEDPSQVSSELSAFPMPFGVSRIKDVDAKGTGCRNPDDWSVEILPYGKGLAIHHKSYDTSVQPGDAFSTSDCQIKVAIDAPPGYTFAPAAIDFNGYAYLNRSGMKASYSSEVYFQGDRVRSEDRNTSVSNATNSALVSNAVYSNADLLWKPCGLDRDLNISTRLTLHNDASKGGHGYLRGDTTALVALAWKRCW